MFSIIVCTYNRDAYIFNTLECVAKNDFSVNDYELVVVNNNSSDKTKQECIRFQESYPKTNFLYIEEQQQGLSYARNRGIKESHGDFLVFIDDDAYVSRDYLKNLRNSLNVHTDIFAFGGKIEPLYETGKEPAWMSPRLIPLVSAIDLGNEIQAFSKKSYPIGANMGFRRACVEQVGMFSTFLGRNKKNLIGGEEKDFFERVRESKMGIYYLPDVCVKHVIPEYRTTIDYVKKIAFGIGASEKLRCLSVKKRVFAYFNELYKWCGTLLLWIYYFVLGKKNVANVLVQFRWNVSKGLLTYKG